MRPRRHQQSELRVAGVKMNSRRRDDELDCAIREGNRYSNIVLGCLVSAAALVVVFFLIGLGVIS